MFCPKCGTENPSDHNYCRSCREDLKLIARAYKKSLPVKIAAAIDAVLDSKSERFRRNSIMMLLIGIGSAVATELQAPASKGFWFSAFIAVFGFVMAAWEYLAFKRCESLGKDLENLPSPGSFTTGSLTTLKLTSDTAENRDIESKLKSVIYCPTCSAESQQDQQFCPRCGADLQAVRLALGHNPKNSWLDQRLNAYVVCRSSDAKIGRAATLCLLLGILYSTQGGIYGNATYIALSAMYFFMGGWDYLVYRRIKKAEDAALDAASLRDQPATTKELQQAGTQNTSFSRELTRKLNQPVEHR
ncbi:MAG TPA: zinc ribbon domain-containing protein [Blastocatellia bacterium]|nr:zinc ribbon domain-containing protein [Blastocatellia bacterium]